jgi:hypothetical protein
VTDGLSNLRLSPPAATTDPAAMSPQQAAERRAELMADAKWRESYLAGDRQKLDELTKLHTRMANATLHVNDDGAQVSRIEQMYLDRGRSPEIAAQATGKVAVSREEKAMAQRQLNQLKGDRAFYERLLKGGVAEREMWDNVHIVLGYENDRPANPRTPMARGMDYDLFG